MPDCIPTLEAAPVVCFADHTAGVATHGATVGLSGCVARARQRAGQDQGQPGLHHRHRRGLPHRRALGRRRRRVRSRDGLLSTAAHGCLTRVESGK